MQNMADDPINTRMNWEYYSKINHYITLGNTNPVEEYLSIINGRRSFIEKAKEKLYGAREAIKDKYDQMVHPDDSKRAYKCSMRNAKKRLSQLERIDEIIDEEIRGKDGLLEKLEETEKAINCIQKELEMKSYPEFQPENKNNSRSYAFKQKLRQQDRDSEKVDMAIILETCSNRLKEYEQRIEATSAFQIALRAEQSCWRKMVCHDDEIHKWNVPLERDLAGRRYQPMPEVKC